MTKSGTNRFHGSLYDVHRDSDWNSNSWANVQNGDPKPVSKQRDWGYTLGGPIGRPGGASSGGICAFTVAWERPDQFGKVVSWIGSFTNIASGESKREGGHNYAALLRKTPIGRKISTSTSRAFPLSYFLVAQKA